MFFEWLLTGHITMRDTGKTCFISCTLGRERVREKRTEREKRKRAKVKEGEWETGRKETSRIISGIQKLEEDKIR